MRKGKAYIMVGVLFLTSASTYTYSSNESPDLLSSDKLVSKIKEQRRDEKKKYVGEVKYKNSTKRYVGDAANDEVENSKRRGKEKRYVSTEEDEELFFKKEKDSSFEYDYKDAELKDEDLKDARYKLHESKE